MSSITTTGTGSGGAVFTLISPNTSTNRTLTLPDETGTIATRAFAGNASNLTTGTIPSAARLGTGTPSATTFLRGDLSWQTISGSGVGSGQTWQAPARANGVTYTNTTALPIMVVVGVVNLSRTLTLIVDGFVVGYAGNTTGYNSWTSVCAIVPPGSTYSCSGGHDRWTELR
jgi:hypothetical protein